MSRILVTSALPYINGVKHLGNLVGSMLPADVYARFERQRRGAQNVLFICATDEHGTPAELAALEEGQSVEAYCDHWHREQKRLYDGFRLAFDHFGRSSSKENRALTQNFAKTLWEAGFIAERVTRQVYSRADGRFLPDRYVIGTCPHCGYDRARGDQCENCTRVLDPVDLINPRSALSNSPDVEIRESKHLFLKQTSFDAQLRRWIQSKKGDWPHLVTSIALKWLDEGLQDRGITRDLKWGVPVNAAEWGPNPDGELPDVEGLTGKVFYVWFDAPIEYIAATAEWAALDSSRDWEGWWRGDAASDVTYVEFMGKDNVPFHTVGFPCTLFGVNSTLPDDGQWKLVDRLKGFNWLNYYGGKFSTSQKRGIFMDAALDILPSDYWRWYLMANAPESADASFAWDHFAATVNKDLADVLGNFVNRVLKFGTARFGGLVPSGGEAGAEELALMEALEAKRTSIAQLFEGFEFRKAVAELRSAFVLGNEYLTRAAPWTVIKTDPVKAGVSVRLGLNLIHLFAHLSWSVIPDAAKRMHETLLPAPDIIPWPTEPMPEFLSFIAPGQPFSVPDVLFRKIEDGEIRAFETRFGGQA